MQEILGVIVGEFREVEWCHGGRGLSTSIAYMSYDFTIKILPAGGSVLCYCSVMD